MIVQLQYGVGGTYSCTAGCVQSCLPKSGSQSSRIVDALLLWAVPLQVSRLAAVVARVHAAARGGVGTVPTYVSRLVAPVAEGGRGGGRQIGTVPLQVPRLATVVAGHVHLRRVGAVPAYVSGLAAVVAESRRQLGAVSLQVTDFATVVARLAATTTTAAAARFETSRRRVGTVPAHVPGLVAVVANGGRRLPGRSGVELGTVSLEMARLVAVEAGGGGGGGRGVGGVRSELRAVSFHVPRLVAVVTNVLRVGGASRGCWRVGAIPPHVPRLVAVEANGTAARAPAPLGTVSGKVPFFIAIVTTLTPSLHA